MDACFGFVRKKSAGVSLNDPRFGTRFFADQTDVDNFVLENSKQAEKSENVSAHCNSKFYIIMLNILTRFACIVELFLS